MQVDPAPNTVGQSTVDETAQPPESMWQLSSVVEAPPSGGLEHVFGGHVVDGHWHTPWLLAPDTTQCCRLDGQLCGAEK
jgi:hypothetical protein